MKDIYGWCSYAEFDPDRANELLDDGCHSAQGESIFRYGLPFFRGAAYPSTFR